MALSRTRLFAFAAVLAGAVAVLTGQQTTYAVYTADGRKSLTVREGAPETIALDQLTALFGLTFTEDKAANGLVIGTRKGRIIAVPGQSFIQVPGRGVVGLDAPVRKERNNWVASIDFLTKALGPALGEPVVIRRSSKLVLVGNVRVPQVGGRIERAAAGVRVVLSIQPATPHKVTRDGNKLIVKFDAVALDPTPLTGFVAEFASAAKFDGTSLIIDLGPSAATFKAEDDRTQEVLTIEVLPPAPVAPPPAPPLAPNRQLPPTAPVPPIDLSPTMRIVVIDPGHGGEDEGVKGVNGSVEKELTLLLARRLKAAIESRLGLRVLLTREGDETLPVDRRAAFANNNKADLFVSLHANASSRPSARGAEVYTLNVHAYPPISSASDARRRTVPLLGGGSRVIDAVPWELAQLPFADQSATFGSIITQHFTERSVGLFGRSNPTAPLRVLAGANMPAVLIELGFLSNAEDEAAITGADGQTAIIEALVAAITDVRRGFPATERHRP